MRVRRLQHLTDDEQWEDHGYAYERGDGQVLLRYNALVWGRIGAEYNVKLRESETVLEEVHTVIPSGKRLRWLEIEEIDGNPEHIKVVLDLDCKIPLPERVTLEKSAAA